MNEGIGNLPDAALLGARAQSLIGRQLPQALGTENLTPGVLWEEAYLYFAFGQG